MPARATKRRRPPAAGEPSRAVKVAAVLFTSLVAPVVANVTVETYKAGVAKAGRAELAAPAIPPPARRAPAAAPAVQIGPPVPLHVPRAAGGHERGMDCGAAR